jgi:hypothetical protein
VRGAVPEREAEEMRGIATRGKAARITPSHRERRVIGDIWFILFLKNNHLSPFGEAGGAGQGHGVYFEYFHDSKCGGKWVGDEYVT